MLWRSIALCILGAIVIGALSADQIELIVGAAFLAILAWPHNSTEQ